MAERFSVTAVLSATDRNFSSVFRSATDAADRLGSMLSSGLSFGVFSAIGERAVDTVAGRVGELIDGLNESSAAWKTFQSTMEMNGHAADEISAVREELQSFAQQTIYDSADMASAFAILDAVGTESTLDLVKGFGGLAAAALDPEQAMRTLSQQATQMAAKPKVAWEDFKLVLDQTPAGVAAVAKEMGMSSQEMIAAVQDGKVATEDFFAAISKVGTNDAFTKLATEYKTVDEAIAGLTETATNKLLPAYDALSQIGISAVSAITDRVGALDGSMLASLVTVDNLKTALTGVGTAAAALLGGAKAAGAIGAAVSLASQHGLTLSDGFQAAGRAVGQVSGAVSGLQERLGKINLAGISKGLTNGFGRAGKTIDGFGGDVAAAMEAVSSRFQGAGLKVYGVFESLGGRVGKVGKTLSKPLSAASGALGKLGARASAVAKPFAGLASALGNGIATSANVGMTALGKMGSALTSVMGVAMHAIAPAAIAGLLLAGLGLVSSQFGGQLDALLRTATEKGPQVITGFVAGIQSKLPSLIASGAQLLNGFLTALTANLPAILSGGVGLVTSLVQGVAQAAPTLIPAAVELVGTLVGGILNALPDLLLCGLELLESLTQGIADNAGLIAQTASDLILNFAGSVVSNLPQILDTGVQVLQNLLRGVISVLPQLLLAGIQAVSGLLGGVLQALPGLMAAGVEMVQTLVAGIAANLPQILSAAVTLLTNFLTGLLQALPSIVVGGAQIVLSLVTGMIGMLPSIVQAGWDLICSLGNAIVTAIPEIITGAVEGIKTIFNDLWAFITGKTEEGAAQTAQTTQALSQSVTASTAAMSADTTAQAAAMQQSVTASFENMNLQAAGEMAGLTDSVTGSLADMSGAGIADMGTLSAGIIDEAGTANSAASAEMESLSGTVSSAMDEIGSTTGSAMDGLQETVTQAMAGLSSAVEEAMRGAETSVGQTMTAISASAGDAMDQCISIVRRSVTQSSELYRKICRVCGCVQPERRPVRGLQRRAQHRRGTGKRPELQAERRAQRRPEACQRGGGGNPGGGKNPQPLACGRRPWQRLGPGIRQRHRRHDAPCLARLGTSCRGSGARGRPVDGLAGEHLGGLRLHERRAVHHRGAGPVRRAGDRAGDGRIHRGGAGAPRDPRAPQARRALKGGIHPWQAIHSATRRRRPRRRADTRPRRCASAGPGWRTLSPVTGRSGCGGGSCSPPTWRQRRWGRATACSCCPGAIRSARSRWATSSSPPTTPPSGRPTTSWPPRWMCSRPSASLPTSRTSILPAPPPGSARWRTGAAR